MKTEEMGEEFKTNIGRTFREVRRDEWLVNIFGVLQDGGFECKSKKLEDLGHYGASWLITMTKNFDYDYSQILHHLNDVDATYDIFITCDIIIGVHKVDLRIVMEYCSVEFPVLKAGLSSSLETVSILKSLKLI